MTMNADPLRLFLAFDLPRSLQTHLASVISELRELDARSGGRAVKWVKAENMHLTLKFFGDTDPALVSVIRKAIDASLSSAKLNSVYRLRTEALGAFPNFKRPRVFWADLVGSDLVRLEELADSLEERFVSAGFEPENKRFKAHLTIGRIRPRADGSAIARVVEQYPYSAIDLKLDTLKLIQSELTREGPLYTTLQSWPLGAERFGD